MSSVLKRFNFYVVPMKALIRFKAETDRQLPVSEWDNFLHPANPIPAMNGVYYAVIKT
jgi:mRNA degradation ribonuclease J1/J2